MKNSNNDTQNPTRELPACSLTPLYQRVPLAYFNIIHETRLLICSVLTVFKFQDS